MYNQNTLDIDRLHRIAPSVFAMQPYQGTSDKYKFIPTIEVVQRLAEHGFTPSRAMESRSRIEDKKGYTKHMIRFRNPQIMPQVGDLVPEVVLINSHDGAGAFRLSAGIYRLVCSNGLVAGNDMADVRKPHVGDVGSVLEGVFEVVESIPRIMETAREWQSIQLTDKQAVIFAEAAAPLRWEADALENLPVNPAALLRPRRRADTGNDLWTIYNVIQESILKGGIRQTGSTGKVARSRAVASVDGDARLNKSLWTLAAKMAELVG